MASVRARSGARDGEDAGEAAVTLASELNRASLGEFLPARANVNTFMTFRQLFLIESGAVVTATMFYAMESFCPQLKRRRMLAAVR